MPVDVADAVAAAGPVLIVGAVTRDRFADGDTLPGGGVSFAARVASALGVRAYVLTVGARDADLGALEGHEVAAVRAQATLAFAFDRSGEAAGARRLRLEASPQRTLTLADVPREWPRPRTLILAPLLPDDLDVASFLDTDPEECALLAQGLQRLIAPNGRVVHHDAPTPGLVDAAREGVSIFLSEEETAAWPAAARDAIAQRARRLVITHGAAGADVHTRDGVTHIDARPAHAVDTTGAGDVFAAALILAARAGDGTAARLAAAYAAARVERRGPAPLPNRAEIEARLAAASAEHLASGDRPSRDREASA